MGILFAAGLSTQCDEAEAHIRSQLVAVERRCHRQRANNGRDADDNTDDSDVSSRHMHQQQRPRLIVNVVGLSRGGCAAMMLAQRLADCDTARLRLNLCLV